MHSNTVENAFISRKSCAERSDLWSQSININVYADRIFYTDVMLIQWIRFETET